MKLIMENWNRFLLNEAAKTAEELPEHVYITIKGNKNLFHVTYTDINGFSASKFAKELDIIKEFVFKWIYKFINRIFPWYGFFFRVI